MQVWAIADLHLSFGTKDKQMDIFGDQWKNHEEKIALNWKNNIHANDLVLIAGDISWAMNLSQVHKDLQWIDALPGTKIMIRGNHDYWWPSLSKLHSIIPPSIHPIHNTAIEWQGISIGGSRLWDTLEYNFSAFFPPTNKEITPLSIESTEAQEKIFNRELQRLKLSLQQMNPDAKTKIVMTHYPPIGAELFSSQASSILEEYHIDICVFGHLHGARPSSLPFGTKNNVSYHLTSCDYLNFSPIKIATL